MMKKSNSRIGKNVFEKLADKRGASMVLVVCLFLVLCVLGINLLNVANANVINTALEQEKEQTMLYVSSVYDIVNDMIEDGAFSDPATGLLPDTAETKDASGFQDGNGKNIPVKVTFHKGAMPIEAHIEITCTGADGTAETYTVISTYSSSGVAGGYRRESCKGLVDHAG
ncbi:MAG: hypothetical protein J6B10_07305 [Lachnospiraceae bacterium]|nr:hypothetical protein [Lachnospiraceae bacterium]